jgi:hypothetical protein
MVLPDDIKGHWVKFNDSRCQPDEPWHPKVTITRPATVVKEKDVTFPRESLWDHMGMMDTDELTKAATLRCILGILRSYSPDDLPRVATDDGHDVRVSLADDEILRIKACIGDRVQCIPFILTKQTERVRMEYVSIAEDARVDVHTVSCLSAKTKLVEMLTRAPLESCEGPIPIHLVNNIILEEPPADTGVSDGMMSKDKGLT